MAPSSDAHSQRSAGEQQRAAPRAVTCEPDPRLLRYDFSLPPDQIARVPASDRAAARLLVLGEAGAVHSGVAALPELLRSGDLLVVNDTRVLRARLAARRKSGGEVEALLLGAGPGPVLAMLRPGRRLRSGEVLSIEGAPDASLTLLETQADGTWLVDVQPSPELVMAQAGTVPLPPYLGRAAEAADLVRYQTVYAREPGAVAAPTAGLHLTEALLAELQARGVGLARVTLHVGPGTFRKLRSEDLDSGHLHEEHYVVPHETVSAIEATKAAGGRVVAVGTTTTRALESAAATGTLRGGPGRTTLFIQDGYDFQVVDLLLTNFHLPSSSLLMLVCAFGGQDRVMAAYDVAVREGYRFYSYGDAMLVPRSRP